MTFLGLEARTDLPKVPYPTALDFFVFLSFAFIFATILQFAFVHYFTKYGSGECYFNAEDFLSESESDEDELLRDRSRHLSTCQNHQRNEPPQLFEVIPLTVCSVPPTPVKSRSRLFGCLNVICWRESKRKSDSVQSTPYHVSTASAPNGPNPGKFVVTQLAKVIQSNLFTIVPVKTTRSSFSSASHHSIQNHRRRKRLIPRFNSVSKIDRASRVVFPLSFLIINLFYWYWYLYNGSKIDKFSNLLDSK